MTAPGVVTAFQTIDGIRSVSDMRKALSLLDEPVRVRVLVYALGHSRFQFTWSWLATTFDVDPKDYPQVQS